MRLLTILICGLVVVSLQPVSSSQEQNVCDIGYSVECGSIDGSVSSTLVNIGDVSEIHISSNGDYLAYKSTDKVTIIDTISSETVYSEFLYPGYSLGLDYSSGKIVLFNETNCQFPIQSSEICDKNSLIVSSNHNMIDSNPSIFFSAGGVVTCELPRTCFLCDHCYGGSFAGDGTTWSIDGKYAMTFSKYEVDTDVFSAPDYDGVISFYESIDWGLNYGENQTINKTVAVEIGEFHIPHQDEDDLYAMLWSADSKYAYLLTCESLFSIDIEDLSFTKLTDNPIECDQYWADSSIHVVDFEQKLASISLDGSVIAYVHGEDLAIYHLQEQSSKLDLIITLGVIVLIGLGAFNAFRNYAKRKFEEEEEKE